MSLHRIFIPDPAALRPGEVVIGGDEARHAARVKRLEAGDPVEVLDGAGQVASGAVQGVEKHRDQWRVRVVIREIRRVEAVRPRLEVFAPAPKGPRLEAMIDGLCQAGAAAWRPLVTARTVVEPREGKLERIARVAAEASKQCARAWALEVGEPVALADAVSAGAVVADGSGETYRPCGLPVIRLLIGPEGGWDGRELEAIRAAGARLARFGPHVMRVETAAVVGAAIVLDAESRA